MNLHRLPLDQETHIEDGSVEKQKSGTLAMSPEEMIETDEKLAKEEDRTE